MLQADTKQHRRVRSPARKGVIGDAMPSKCSSFEYQGGPRGESLVDVRPSSRKSLRVGLVCTRIFVSNFCRNRATKTKHNLAQERQRNRGQIPSF